MKIKLSSLFALLISTVLFAQDDWKTFEQDNYSISHPNDWTYSDQKPQPTIQFVLMSEEGSQAHDNFSENVNLNLENLAGKNLDIEGYAQLALDMVKQQIPSAEVLSVENISLDNHNAKKVIWLADFGGMTLKFSQVFLIKNETAYVLTFTASEAEYDQYIKVGDKILLSFKFKK